MKKFLIVAVVVFAVVVPAVAGAAKPTPSTVTVADGVWGATTTGTVETQRADTELFIQCYNPDYVYAAFFPVVDGQVTVGPLAATTWPRSGASCTAELGYITRDGWGRWRVLAATTFDVSA